MNQLQKRKFRKGAVHNRKKVFTNSNEKIKRNCNLCQKEVIFDTKFERFCEMCKQEDEYKFGYDLTTFGKGNYII
jgi:hypothetical protein